MKNKRNICCKLLAFVFSILLVLTGMFFGEGKNTVYGANTTITISESRLELYAGTTRDVAATVSSDGASNISLKWTIDDESIAKFVNDSNEEVNIVTTTGSFATVKIKGLTDGTTTVTVEAQDGSGETTVFSVEVEYLPFSASDMIDISGSGHYYDSTTSTHWFSENSEVLVRPGDGYQVSADGSSWNASGLTLTANNNEFYIRDATRGAITDKINLLQLGVYKRDGVAPTGKIELDENNSWQTLINPITFDRFYKESKTVRISAMDNESGIDSNNIKYYVANDGVLATHGVNESEILDELKQLSPDDWQIYSSEGIYLQANGKNVVYAQLTDNVGNISYISSDGIVLYSDSEAATQRVTYNKLSTQNPEIKINLKGNTISEVKLDQTVLEEGADKDYSITTSGVGNDAVATIALNRNKLDELEATDYTVTVAFNLQGEAFVAGVGNIKPADIVIKLKVSEVTENWGTESTRADGVKQYVVADSNSLDYGKTSVEISSENLDENDILWLREESDGRSTWYGVDLSDSSFSLSKGLRFYVQWISPADDKYDAIEAQLDEEQRGRIEDNKGWIFLIGVEDQDGKKVQSAKPFKVYVQIGDDWDVDDLNAYYIAAGNDVKVPVNHLRLHLADGTDDFGCMTLSHFSPYIIFDELVEENISEENNSEENSNEENKVEIISPNTGDISSKFLIFGLEIVFISVLSIMIKLMIRMRKLK